MKLTSTLFAQNDTIPTPYTCDGSGISPSLEISEVPEQAKSLVLLMEDPDVPSSVREDNMWNHWIVFNIDPHTSSIPEGHEPQGVLGTGTSGDKGYHPPCPPDGEHRYIFKLFALSTELDLPEGASKEDVQQAMDGYIIDKAELVGLYDRKL